MAEAKRTGNFVTSIVIYDDVAETTRAVTGQNLTNAVPIDVCIVDTTGNQVTPAKEAGGNLATIASAVSGTEMQVDIVSITAGTNVLGKVRLVDSGGAEITETTDHSMNVTIVADDAGVGGGTQYTLGDDTYTEATSKATLAGAVRNDTLATLADTDNELAPLQVNANGALYTAISSIAAGTNVVGKVRLVDSGGSEITETSDHSINVTIVADDAGVGGGTQYTEADTDATITGTAIMWEDTSNTLRAVSSAKPLPISVATIPSHAVTNAGTFAVQISDTSFAVGDGNALGEGVLVQGDDGTDRKNVHVDATTGDVQVDVTNTVTVDLGGNNDVTMAVLPDTAGGELSSMATDLGTIDTDTGNIATYTAGAETALEKIDGAIVGPGEPTIDSYTHFAINLNAGADQVLVSSAANKQIWVYGVAYTCSVAGTVSFQDEDDTAVSGIMDHAANSGLSSPPSGNFAMPIWKLGTDKDLEVDVVDCAIDGWLDYAIVSV